MNNKLLIFFISILLISCEKTQNSESSGTTSEKPTLGKTDINFLVADKNIFTIDKEGNYYVPGQGSMFDKTGQDGRILLQITATDLEEATVSSIKVNEKGEIFAAGLLYPKNSINPEIDFMPVRMEGPHFFIAKFNPRVDSTGKTIEWIKHGTNGNRINPEILYLSRINDIELGKDGSIYFIGTVITNTTIGQNKLFPEVRGKSMYNKSLVESNDIMFGRMDSLGNMVWVKRIGSTVWPGFDHPNDQGNDVTLDNDGNILIACGVFGNPICDKDTFNSETSSLHPLIAKYDTDGNLIFQKNINKSMYGMSKVVVDQDNNIIASGENGAFIVKYDKEGRELWYKEVNPSIPNNAGTWGSGLVVLSNGDIITGGPFEKKAVIDSIVVNTFEKGHPDIFIALYNQEGKLKSIQTFEKNEIFHGDRLFNILIKNNDIIISGDFGGSPVANITDQLIREGEWLFSYKTSQRKAPVHTLCKQCKGKGRYTDYNNRENLCVRCDGSGQE